MTKAEKKRVYEAGLLAFKAACREWHIHRASRFGVEEWAVCHAPDAVQVENGTVLEDSAWYFRSRDDAADFRIGKIFDEVVLAMRLLS